MIYEGHFESFVLILECISNILVKSVLISIILDKKIELIEGVDIPIYRYEGNLYTGNVTGKVKMEDRIFEFYASLIGGRLIGTVYIQNGYKKYYCTYNPKTNQPSLCIVYCPDETNYQHITYSNGVPVQYNTVSNCDPGPIEIPPSIN